MSIRVLVAPSGFKECLDAERVASANAADVRRQGGLLVPSVTRWDAARPAVAQAEPFKAPGVVTVAYRNPLIASDAAGVLRQGGFATAGAMRWLPTAPVTAEANVGNVKLGSL